jgi:hypothetical protein
MANDAAWQAGVDIATKGRGKAKDQDKDQDGDKAQGGKKPGGLIGLESKGLTALGNKMTRKKPASGAVKGGAGSAGGQAPSYMSFQPVAGSLKKGGRVRKTGLYRLHKGEDVIPAKRRSGKATARKRTLIKA